MILCDREFMGMIILSTLIITSSLIEMDCKIYLEILLLNGRTQSSSQMTSED